MFQVGSLFAGIGGFCMAFAKEGFKVAWANEKDRFAIETYRRNFRGTPTYLKPVEEFSCGFRGKVIAIPKLSRSGFRN